jgi:type II secretory pathway component PulC
LKINLANPQQRVKTVVLAIMIALSLYLLVLTVLVLRSPDLVVEPLQRIASANVSRWNWFGGQQVVQVAAVAEQDQELSDASINAELLGVMLAGDASSATLKFKGKPEEVFQRDDQINASIKLLAIEAYRIIVSENGVKKQVMMNKPDTIMETATTLGGSAQQLQSKGFALANMFGAVPVNIAGGSGFKMNNLSSDIKMMADIRDGDVVMQVDGLSVQDLMSNPMKLMSYSSATSLPVTVMRNGRQETIYVNAASLSAKMLPTFGLKP